MKKAISLTLLFSFLLSNVIAANAFTAVYDDTNGSGYTTDLTQLGRQGRLRQSLSFENDVNHWSKPALKKPYGPSLRQRKTRKFQST